MINSRRNKLLDHYRNRAREVRSVAENYVDPARKMLLDIATMYDNLAEDKFSGSLVQHVSVRDFP